MVYKDSSEMKLHDQQRPYREDKVSRPCTRRIGHGMADRVPKDVGRVLKEVYQLSLEQEAYPEKG